MKLIIVESPTKAKTISKFLSKDYQVLSSYGHVRDLPKNELGVDIKNDFKPKYIIPTKARKVVKQLKDAAKKADLVILGTDSDREGEAIAWHISHILKLNNDNSQRIVFHEITKEAINKALKNPGQLDTNLVNAQQARRILDRLVGYKLSPFLWKKVVKGLSAGRVQSVAVKLIVDREREIEKFKSEQYWSIEAKLRPQSDKETDEFLAKLFKENGKLIPKLGIKTKQEADRILADLKDSRYKISNIRKKEIQRYPSPPFTTSTLQQEASRKLGFSTKQTMVIAQQLYEGIKIGKQESAGLITYHRTDSLNLSNQALSDLQEFIKNEFGQNYALTSPKFYKTKSKSAQEAHEAIRPTQVNYKPDQIKQYLDQKQYKLYDLIWKKFVACQMVPARFDSTTFEIEAKDGQYIFKSTGQILKFDGFLKIYPVKYQEAELPSLTEQEILKLIKLISEQHATKPPGRYTEASLVKILEEYGIGRPSTYAPIISTIQERGYVRKDDQKRFIPTEISFIVIDLLKENFSQIVNVKFTAYLEKDLDRIAQGRQSWLTVLKEFYQPFQANLAKKYKEVEKKNLDQPTDKKCPKCKSPLIIKLGRFGKFYACSAFPNCKHTEPIISSTGVICPECVQGKIAERRTRKGKIFYSCSRYPKCKYALWDKPINEKCPECNSILVQKGKQIKCSNKECNYKQSHGDKRVSGKIKKD